MPPPARKIRCKWYNDLGYPRVNPKKVDRGQRERTGCTRSTAQCYFVHPDHPDWNVVDSAIPPRAHEYPDNCVPMTPRPSWTKRPTRTSEQRVKPEPQSPRLPPFSASSDRDGSFSRELHSAPLMNGMDGRRHSPPYPDRSGEWDRDTVQELSRDWTSNGREERAYGNDRERERNYGWSRERDKNHDGEYSPDRQNSTSSQSGSIAFGNRECTRTTSGNAAHSPQRSLLERVSDREPTYTAALKDLAHQPASVWTALPPPNPPPSVPPPPICPPSRSSISSVATFALGVPPDSAMSTAMPPPPTPMSAASTSTAFQHSLPPKPAFLDAPQELVQVEPLSREERAELWDNRIELLSEAIAAKRAYNDRVADMKQMESLVSPERTANLIPAAREQIAASLQTAQARVDAARAHMKAAHQKVLELDFWPVRRKPETYDAMKGEDEKLIEDGHAEVNKSVSDLGAAINRIDRQMKEVTQFVASRARPNVVSAPVPSEWVTSDVTRGMKRRKIGEDGAYTSDSGSTTLGRLSPAPSASTSADTIRDSRRIAHRLVKLETSFHELENLYMQSEAHAQDELSAMIDLHVERVRDELMRGVKVRYSERVDRLEDDVAQLDREVQELVGEVTTLVGVEAQVREVMRFVTEERESVEAEREKLRAATEELASRTSAMQVQLTANIEETRTLQRALTLFSQKPPSHASHVPTVDHLTTELLPRLIDAVRADLGPLLLEQKADVLKMIRENVPQMNAVHERVEKIVQLPEVVALLQTTGVLNGKNADVEGQVNENATKVGQVNGTSVPAKPPPAT